MATIRAKVISNALAATMAPKWALFMGLSSEQRAEWPQSRLAAYCGVSWQTIHNWTGRPPAVRRGRAAS